MTDILANDLTLAAGILQAGCTCTGIPISRMRKLAYADESAQTWHLYTIVQAMRSQFITWRAIAEVLECDVTQVGHLIKIISDRDYNNKQVMFRVAAQIYAENATAAISRP